MQAIVSNAGGSESQGSKPAGKQPPGREDPRWQLCQPRKAGAKLNRESRTAPSPSVVLERHQASVGQVALAAWLPFLRRTPGTCSEVRVAVLACLTKDTRPT
ncbi:hypothetical protein VTN96DRAFT_9148 [Rasamsonia emersonii]